jgi:hypothetical protein
MRAMGGRGGMGGLGLGLRGGGGMELQMIRIKGRVEG